MSSSEAAGSAPEREVNHALRWGVIWVVSTLIAVPLVIFVLGPELPPGKASEQANGHVTDNIVLLAMATPVLLMVITYLIYAIINFRQPKGAVLEGPAVRGPGHAGSVPTCYRRRPGRRGRSCDMAAPVARALRSPRRG